MAPRRQEGERRHQIKKDDQGRTLMRMERAGRWRHMRLGRRKDQYDERDHVFERPRTRTTAGVTFRYWSDSTWRGDQGNTPQCVGYSAVHRIENSPRTYPAAGPIIAPKKLYDFAQANDEWPGADYDGTSCRAGAKAALAFGFISEYQRVETMEDFKRLLLTRGGVIVGTDWTDDMFNPIWLKDRAGVGRWTLKPTGDLAGGHAWLVNGINLPGNVGRMLQSWGPSWGDNAHAWIDLDDLYDLVYMHDGDAWHYVEVS